MVNLEDGSILRGEEAPRRRDLDRWLEENRGYMVDRADPEEEVVSYRHLMQRCHFSGIPDFHKSKLSMRNL